MFSFLSEGNGKYRIMFGNDTAVGWINDRTIGFRGMTTERAAHDAAAIAWQAMDAVLITQYAGWPRREPRLDQMRLAHDGAYEWFHEGTMPIARLLRPHRRAFNGTFGIELVLPSYSTEGVAVAVAQAVAKAVVPFIMGPFPDPNRPIPEIDEAPAAS
jgi:hypothetical protein